MKSLNGTYSLSAEQKQFYRENEFIKLKNVLSADEIAYFETVITDQVSRLSPNLAPLEARDTYGKAFTQITNIWKRNEAVKHLVFSTRLAGIASTLMQVDGVRLYHDQALFKEAGGGYTPWHADQYYWPLESPKCITAWIPLQQTSLAMGALEFSAGSQHLLSARGLAISDDSEVAIEQMLTASGCDRVIEPFDLGEVSFHSGWLYHRAAPNTTEHTRKVMCVIYMDKEMILKAPSHADQQRDWDTWCPGARVGEPIDTPLNPILFETN